MSHQFTPLVCNIGIDSSLVIWFAENFRAFKTRFQSKNALKFGRSANSGCVLKCAQFVGNLSDSIGRRMTHVVTKSCIGCKDTACAQVCPCECFHEGPDMLFIDPENCIDCGACIVECPVEAIYQDDELPEEFSGDLALNAKMVEIYPQWTAG